MAPSPSPPRCRFAACLVVSALAAACVEVRQAPPPSFASLPGVVVERRPAQSRAFVGLELEERLAGSLEDLEMLGGLFVVEVEPGSPAEAAGIEAGDRIVRADGVELDGVDQWRAVLAEKRPGDRLHLEVERRRGLADVDLVVGGRGGGRLPERRRFVDRVRWRAVFETVVVVVDGARRGAARVVETLPGSPLAEEVLGAGTAILALDGEPVSSAVELLLRSDRRDPGDEVDVTCLRNGRVREVEVELAAPPRELLALRVPILFTYRRDPERRRVEFALGDFLLFSLYDYRRDVRTVRHRILGWFVIERGTGELEEEGR